MFNVAGNHLIRCKSSSTYGHTIYSAMHVGIAYYLRASFAHADTLISLSLSGKQVGSKLKKPRPRGKQASIDEQARKSVSGGQPEASKQVASKPRSPVVLH